MPVNNNPGLDEGKISGQVLLLGDPVERNVIALSYEPFDLAGSDDGTGNPIKVRQVVGTGRSGADGNYQIDLGTFTGEVIVIALDEYGERWKPNTQYTVGDVIRPTSGNETGYAYRCTVPGGSYPSEPIWWINTGGDNTGQVGTATFEAIESWWPLAHAPVVPEIVAYQGLLIDAYFDDTVLITHFEPSQVDTLLDDLWELNSVHITGDSADSVDGITPSNDAAIGDRGGEYPDSYYRFEKFGNAGYNGLQAAYAEHGTSLYFDGADDYIRSAFASVLWGMHHPEMTVEFWIRPNSKAGLQYIVSNRTSSLNNQWVIELTAGKKIAFVWWNNSGAQGGYKQTDLTVPDNAWTHYLLQVDGMDCDIWTNGVWEKRTAMINKPASTTRDLIIGEDPSDPTRDYKGWLADLRITRALRQTTGVDFTPPAEPLPIRRSTRADEFVNAIPNNIATYYGYRSYIKNDPADAQFGDGFLYALEGWLDVLSNTIDQELYFGTGDYTIEWAMNFDALPADARLVSSGFNGVSNGFAVHKISDHRMQVTIGGIVRFTTTAVLAPATWYRFALCRKDSQTRFFIDGTQDGPDIADGSNLLLQQIRFGARPDGTDRIEGRIEEVRITKAARYDANYTPAAAPFPDTKYEIDPGDSAIYTWEDATIDNHSFENGMVGWTSYLFGSEPDSLVTSTSTKDTDDVAGGGAVGFYGGSANRGAIHWQDIAIPAGTQLMNWRAWIRSPYTDGDTANAFVVFLDNANNRIDGYGTYRKTRYGGNSDGSYSEPVGPSGETAEQTCFVPPGAVTARLCVGAIRNSGSDLNAGGDNVRVRWGKEIKHGNYWPPAEKLPIVNEDFWLGSFAGWTTSYEGTSGPFITTNSTYQRKSGYAVYGGSSTQNSQVTQDVVMPAGNYSHAEIVFQSKSSAQDPDQVMLKVEWLSVNDTIIDTVWVDGAKGTDPEWTVSTEWAAIPNGTAKVRVTIWFARYNGSALNVGADWVYINLYDLFAPQLGALTPNA